MSMAKQYSIYEAKAKFSELLRQVKQGTDIIVTERGVPIAKVMALQKEETLESRVQGLLRSGLMSEPKTNGDLPKGIRKNGALQRFLKARE